jgi:hypothetical protein
MRFKAIGAFPFLTSSTPTRRATSSTLSILLTLNAGLSVARAQELIDQATEKSKDKSLKTLTNLRFEVAQRERKGGKAPDVFEIADTGQTRLRGEPVRSGGAASP